MFLSINSLIWAAPFVLTLWLAAVGAERHRLDSWSMYLAGSLGLFGALWGGSMFALIMVGNSMDHLRVFEGEKSSFGAFAGAALLSMSFLAWRRLPVFAYVDAAVPATFVGYSIMRILCFMEGHCFGIPTELPWSVTFLPGTQAFSTQVAAGLIVPDALHTLPVHPTQLYHALLGVFAFVVLLRMKVDVSGKRLAAALILYGAGRFVIEFFRGDAIPILGPLVANHFAALVMLVMGIMLWRFRAGFVAATDQTLTT